MHAVQSQHFDHSYMYMQTLEPSCCVTNRDISLNQTGKSPECFVHKIFTSLVLVPTAPRDAMSSVIFVEELHILNLRKPLQKYGQNYLYYQWSGKL